MAPAARDRASVAPAAPAAAAALALGTFLRREGRAASAAFDRVRVVDPEAATLERVVEVDRRAIQVLVAAHVDDHLHAGIVEYKKSEA